MSAASTLAAAVFAAGALVAALESVSEARRQADIARDSYLASTRAWFDVSVDPDSISLKWRDGVGVTLYVKLEGVNNGASPAIEATLSPRLVIDKGMFGASPRDVVSDSCKGWRPINGGEIVFKDGRIDYTGPAFLSWYEIKAVLDRPATRDAIEEHAKATGTVLFYFVACAMYRIAGDDEWHHTGRIYHVGRIDDLPEGERVSFYLKPGEDLESDRLVLTNPGVGAHAD